VALVCRGRYGREEVYTPAVIDWLSTDFKVSIIRAAMGCSQTMAIYRNLPANPVNCKCGCQAIKDGIYVLIDWHDHHGNLHIPESKEFFTQMAKKIQGRTECDLRDMERTCSYYLGYG